MQEQKAHRRLIDVAAIRRIVDQSIQQVFHQVLDRQDVRDLEVQVPGGVLPGQDVDDEAVQRALLLPHHLQGRVEELRQDDEVDRNVILSRWEDLLGRVLSEEQEFPILQFQFRSVF